MKLSFSLKRGQFSLWLALFIFSNGLAQIELDPERDVGLSVTTEPRIVPLNGSGVLNITLHVPPDMHITSREWGFFLVEPQETPGITWGLPSFPSGEPYEDEIVYKGDVIVTLPFTLDGTATRGNELAVDGTVGYQVCTEVDPIYCAPPVEREFAALIEVGKERDAASATASEGNGGASLTIEQRAMKALESGSILALLWVFLGGVGLSFTPCVYPIIPITIAYIGGRSGGSKLRGFILSLVFVLGLGLVYSVLGLIAAATGGVFGLSTQNPWVIGFVTLVFLVMGVGMLGAFEMTLPSSMQSKLASHKKSGYAGALIVGGTTGLVAAPCVGPVLVALLSWISTTGNLFAGFLYMFVFACGLGSLFVVIGTFAGSITALPAAGQWMDSVKRVFGVILIAAALYFGRALIPDEWTVLLTGLALLMLAGMMGAYSRLERETGLGNKIARGLAYFVMITGAFYSLLGLFRLEGDEILGRLQVQGGAEAVAGIGGTDSHPAGINWIKDDEQFAFEMAAKTRKPVMIDFWAEWCAACKELDHKTFSQPQVYDMVNSEFVALKVDGTKPTEDVKAIWDKYGVKGLPTVLFLTPQGEELDRFEAFRTVEQVLPVLNGVVN